MIRETFNEYVIMSSQAFEKFQQLGELVAESILKIISNRGYFNFGKYQYFVIDGAIYRKQRFFGYQKMEVEDFAQLVKQNPELIEYLDSITKGFEVELDKELEV